MDALARLEPVARDLLHEVDEALSTLGAPAEHRIWSLLRDIGTTPADAVAFFTDLTGQHLLHVAEQLREQADGYGAAAVPATVRWEGGAADAYAVRAGALNTHLAQGMAGRLAETASYAGAIGEWQQRSRDRLARTLAEVLGSAQAVTVRLGAADAVRAAADIGAWVLDAVGVALTEGRDLRLRWSERLNEVHYRTPADARPARADATIHLRR
jgi:hypothetical protein